MEATRQRGYGLDDEEFELGIRAVSAPIRDIDGNVIAAMSMLGPSNRLTPEHIPEIAQSLVEVASAVSAHVLREKLAGTLSRPRPRFCPGQDDSAAHWLESNGRRP